jgi:hypothetical protein
MVGARALCDLGNGWLVIGHDSGDLALLRWREPRPEPGEKLQVDLQIDRKWGAITHVCLWGPEQLLVSHRYRPATLYDIEHQTDAPPQPKFRCDLGRAVALGHVLKIGQDERILISKSGLLWRAESTTVEPLDLWREYKRPGFIFDVTAVKKEPGAEVSDGAYLSTDGGVFLLRREQGELEFEIEPVNLPGFTGMCLAVAHLVQGDQCLLWVSDRIGDVHLFWDDVKNLGRRPVWRRSGILQGDLPVMRALASQSLATETPSGFREGLALLGQACRNDRIVVTWYSEQPGNEKPSQRLSWGPLSSLPEKDGWCTEALIADYIEETGAEKPDELTEFLRNPGIELAQSALDAILSEGPERRASQTVTLWTHTLLGAVYRYIHRYSGERMAQNYLGIISWLRLLSLAYSEMAVPAGQARALELLLVSLERNIQYARKWGVFGRTYADRQSILSALEPLSGQETTDRQFDRLVYESMLLQRRVDVETEFPKPTPGGKTPWDVKYLRVPRESGQWQQYIAVSWIKGGVEVYTPPPGARRGEDWLPVSPTPQEEVKPAGEGGGSGYSRRILLGKLGEGTTARAFLLEAPTRTGEEKGPSLRLRWIDGPETSSPSPLTITKLLAESAQAPQEAEPAAVSSGSLEEQESVYSLIELDPSNPNSRLVLVGLQGTKGRPRVGLLRIAPDGELHPLCQKNVFQFPTPFPELRTVKRNPVWSMAIPEEPEEVSEAKGSPYTVILGCGDGQIWKLQLQVGTEDFEVMKSTVTLVGRLGTPVWALTYRESWPGEKPVAKRPSRVVAGGADGTLAAFQALDPQEDHEKYATLWAIQEGGPVARLHAFASENADEGSTSLILALTQYGTAVLISDEAVVEPLRKGADNEKHHRFKVPGQRLGRFSLRSTVFGSALLSFKGDQSFQRQVARLVIATTDGTLRLLSLHYPKHTTRRHEKYESLWNDWLTNLKDGLEGQRSVHGYLLRRPETVRVAVPELTSGLVRWILSPDPARPAWIEQNSSAKQKGMGEPIEQWVPRHLRPLVALDTAWSKGNSIRGKLKKALMTAREAEDKHLFKEILEVALNRINHQLYNHAMGRGESASINQFLQLLEDLEDVKGVWLGSPDNLDIKMRITISKNLLDGDTLWGIARARAKGKEAFGKAVQGRIEQVHRFLGHGDSLLALETLRAANLALVRLCRRLGRPGDWQDMTDGEHQLHWESIRGFYEAVGDFAARAEHPKGSLGEVAAHEICRAYALGMLACPSALVPLSLWMAEADLPEDLRYRVQDQFLILENLLGMKMPDAPRELFGALFERRKNLGGYAELLLSRKLDVVIRNEDLDRKFGKEKVQLAEALKLSDLASTDEDLSRKFGNENVQHIRALKLEDLVSTNENLYHKFGEENVKLIRNLKAFEDITAWLFEMAERLANDAGKVGSDLAKTGKLLEAFTEPEGLSHSAKFWQAALKDLQDRADKFPDLEKDDGAGRPEPEDEIRPRPVRPEVVLFSRNLEEWCREQRQVLREKREKYDIFEPHSRIYDGALAAVERTAHRFREGAAVQKNMVLGVLGHGLLEILDEHLLELWEVAQALDPQRTWDQGEKNRQRSHERGSTTASRFADYMLGRALNAETIPKNLRSLQGLLCYASGKTSGEAGPYTLQRLYEEFDNATERWSIPRDRWKNVELQPREYHFLRLTLSELAQNDRYHGRLGQQDYAFPDVKAVETEDPGQGHTILVFRYPTENDHYARLQAAVKDSGRLQRMVPARPEPRFPSHGTGLYLANLAAAAVGWKLDFADLDEQGRLREKGVLKFSLYREPRTIDHKREIDQ